MMNRRTLLTAATLAATAGATAARAAGPPIDKSAVGYQDVPRNGQVCAACIYFIYKPATGPTPASRCKMVAGPIAPAGWCQIWQPKGK
jgi:hypothetical protein